ncbi:Ldh family oxidoreductase [Clostridium cibarium]|uniref:Ldh family oxidoreductase n=1 Tax=Clostridium cibarium TaxID=2762247 RepID=A0ABR8PY09_9CLOT|nr:Ldh family oxidoreductase [Clostridium cibarium]MBD7913061.1 Ldh family oxidoreductase [Clostridium cibarium]
MSKRISHIDLIGIVREIFLKYKFEPIKAQISAEILVEADLTGKVSHGVSKIGSYYIPLIENHIVNPNAKNKIIFESKHKLIIDGHSELGLCTAHDAMKKSIEKARENEVCITSVLNSTHFGTASFYTQMAAKENYIGIVITNGCPAIVPPGGHVPLTGTNALSISFPNMSEYPIIMDIGMSSTSLGNLFIKMKNNEEVPKEYGAYALLEKYHLHNQKMISPEVILRERMLTPFGGSDLRGKYKGFQLALMIDLFLGIFCGGKFSYEQEIGEASQLFICINPYTFVSKAMYKERVDNIIKVVKNSKVFDGFDALRVPGERAYNEKKKNLKNGVLLEEHLLDELLILSQKFK